MDRLYLTSKYSHPAKVINGYTRIHSNLLYLQMKQSADASYKNGTTMGPEDTQAKKKLFGKLPHIIIGQMLGHGSPPMSKDAQSANR